MTKKAVIIDDDEMDLELLKILLSKEGFSVISTADGPQGILLYKHHKPEIVFLDLGLPSMSGIEVLKEIRAFDPNARVMLITGYGSEGSEQAARQLGAIEYIEKSWDVELMINRISAAIRKIELREM
ncbi:MAG: response regulator [Bacteroidota bacterium]